MSRKLERRLVLALGVWQIIDGLITIIFFGYQVSATGKQDRLSVDGQAVHAIESIFGSLFTFTVMFGIGLLGLGIINLYLSHSFLKDQQISYKIPIYLLAMALLAYMCMDVVTVVLAISASILTLSKNKALKMVQDS